MREYLTIERAVGAAIRTCMIFSALGVLYFLFRGDTGMAAASGVSALIWSRYA